MKKEQNAEKTKVGKLARTKEKVSQWTTNPLNEKVLDYHNYEMTKSESVLYFVAAFLVGGVVSQFFYGGLFQEDGVPTLLTYISNSAAFVIVGLLVGKVFLPVRSRQLAEKRRDTLRRQFRDMLESLTASLAANSTVRDAFSTAYTDMCMQYSDDALISKELDQFRRAEQINVTLDVMMDDFAKRSGVEEIQDFNNVFQVCYGPGGNMSRVINQTHDIICERMEVEDEIQAKIHANEMELNIIMLAPVLIVALMRSANETFAQNLASPVGVAAVTGALVLFAIAYIWGQKIIAVRKRGMLIVKMICLAIGTVLAVLFILLTMRGKKEDWRIEGVPEKEFSDKELWAAGFAMQQMPMFSMDSAVGKKMISASAILHPENGGRFVEYWARLYWARTLSMSLLVLALAFCAAVFMDGYMLFAVLVAGVAMVAVIYSNGANEMSNQLQKRSTECMMEFSNVVSKLTLLMNCGMILKEAWYIVAKSKQGIIYELMQEACREMDNGMASAEAIYNFGVRTGSPEVRKFASIIIQNIEKGGSDVTAVMRQQADELMSQRRQMLLRKGDDAAAQLLAPTTIVLIGVILIIMVAAMSGMDMAI